MIRILRGSLPVENSISKTIVRDGDCRNDRHITDLETGSNLGIAHGYHRHISWRHGQALMPLCEVCTPMPFLLHAATSTSAWILSPIVCSATVISYRV